jgi:hypothetical protein
MVERYALKAPNPQPPKPPQLPLEERGEPNIF